MKGADWLSLTIGAVVIYILYEWMQGASKASGAVVNTLQSAPVATYPASPVVGGLLTQ
jgi:hypothetical protein